MNLGSWIEEAAKFGNELWGISWLIIVTMFVIMFFVTLSIPSGMAGSKSHASDVTRNVGASSYSRAYNAMWPATPSGMSYTTMYTNGNGVPQMRYK